MKTITCVIKLNGSALTVKLYNWKRPVGAITCYKHRSTLTRLILVLIAEVAFHFEIRVRPNASGRLASSSC